MTSMRASLDSIATTRGGRASALTRTSGSRAGLVLGLALLAAGCATASPAGDGVVDARDTSSQEASAGCTVWAAVRNSATMERCDYAFNCSDGAQRGLSCGSLG